MLATREPQEDYNWGSSKEDYFEKAIKPKTGYVAFPEVEADADASLPPTTLIATSAIPGFKAVIEPLEQLKLLKSM